MNTGGSPASHQSKSIDSAALANLEEFRASVLTFGMYLKKCAELAAFGDLGILGWLCLTAVAQDDRIVPIQISNQVGASPRRIRKMLVEMQQRSLIEFTDGPISVTPAGAATLAKLNQAIAKEIEVVFHADRAKAASDIVRSLYGRHFKLAQDPTYVGRREAKLGKMPSNGTPTQ